MEYTFSEEDIRVIYAATKNKFARKLIDQKIYPGLYPTLADSPQDSKPETFDSEDFLRGVFANAKYKVDRDKYPNVAFFGFDTDGKYLFNYNKKSHNFWLSYDLWQVLQSKNNRDASQIEKFIKPLLEHHFKLKKVTPQRWQWRTRILLENHFKSKEVVPQDSKPEPFDSEDFLRRIFARVTYFTDRKVFPDVAFFGVDSNGNYLFHYDDKKNFFWVHYWKIWMVLESKNNWSNEQTRAFVKGVVEDRFKLKGVTPWNTQGKMMSSVEDRFKLNRATTTQSGTARGAENRSKLKEVVPQDSKPEPFDSEAFLRDIFTNAIYKSDREGYPDIAFFGFDTDGKYLFNYNEKKQGFWVSYDLIWSVLESKNNWNYQQTQAFIKPVLEEHLKSKGVTPISSYSGDTEELEEHFKSKEVVPQDSKPEPFDSEAFLRRILTNAIYKSDREAYPDVAFFGFDTDGKYLFNYNEKKQGFWVSYDLIWSVLESKNNWNYQQTQAFIKPVLEEHFKSKGVTPVFGKVRMMVKLGEHFKSKGVTPHCEYSFGITAWEDHFKTKGVEPQDSKPEPFDSEAFLRRILINAIYKTDREGFPDFAFFGFDADGKYLFNYNEKSHDFRVSYDLIWSVLESKNNWNFQQTQAFIKPILEDHFKTKAVTPGVVMATRMPLWEDHFKTKGVTPEINSWYCSSEVEDHFKSKDGGTSEKRSAVEWLRHRLPSLFLDDNGHYAKLFEQAFLLEERINGEAFRRGAKSIYKPIMDAVAFYDYT
jgi:hypothetical protein